MKAALCVFDIGKSNKKFIVYDSELKVLASCSVAFQEIPGSAGLVYEDVESLLSWVKECLNQASQTYEIKCVNLSCHGATYALLNSDDELVHPVLSYTSVWPVEICNQFDATFGDQVDLYLKTGTPNLGTINIGRSIHAFQLQKPDEWAEVKTFLFYPQYLGFRLCGNKAIECTYLGNHSYLWDFQKGAYSQVCKQLGLLEKLPTPLKKPNELLGTISLDNGEKIPLLVGIHDSNAAMYPYYHLDTKNFTLLSTGSWILAMKPNVPFGLTQKDFKESIYFNIDVNQKGLKTLGNQSGLVYSAFADKIGCKDESGFNQLKDLFEQNDLFVLLDASGMVKPESFALIYKEQSYDFQALPRFIEAHPEKQQMIYAALNCSLAQICFEQLLGFGVQSDEKVFVEGGFLKNVIWRACLQLLGPKMQFHSSTLVEAGCYGAATLCALHLGVKVSVENMFALQSFEKNKIEVEHTGYFKSLNRYLKRSEEWKLQNQQ